MADPKIGFVLDTTSAETLPVSEAEMSVIGAVVTAPDADASIALDTPLSVNTSDSAFYELLGAAGTAQAALRAIASQMGEGERAARAVLVVVEEGADDDETIANIAGDPLAFTGIHAFRKASQEIGLTPRIIVAPGYTHQQATPTDANAVCAALPTVLDQLLAVAPVGGPDGRDAALGWRETMQSKRLIPTKSRVRIAGEDGTPVTVFGDAYIAGLFARVDGLHGGLPFHSAGNRAVYGILGPAESLEFSLTDGDTEAQEMLNAGIGVIVRGEYGDDFGIADGGSVYLGVSTAAGDNSVWQFYNQVRGRDYIHLTALRTLRAFKAKYNLNNRTVQAYLNTLDGILSGLAANEQIHATYKIALTPGQNTAASLRDGELAITMSVEEPAPFLRTKLKSTRYEFALTEFVSNLEAQLGQLSI